MKLPVRKEALRNLSALLLLAGWSAVVWASGFPVTVTDELGREVTLAQEPGRIVSMLPSHSETLCAIDACDKLVGVDDFSNYPPEVEQLPRLGGGLHGFDVEAIVELDPDLVVVSQFGELAGALEGLGLQVYAGSPQDLEHLFALFERLGTLVGRAREARQLVDGVRSEIKVIEERTRGLESPRVYFEIDPTPYSVGPDSFFGQAIALAGGENIVGEDMGEFPQLDPEFVIAADPEVIVLGEHTDPDLEARAGWADISAVATGNVVQLSPGEGDIVSRPGPRFVEAVRLFAGIFHPEHFD